METLKRLLVSVVIAGSLSVHAATEWTAASTQNFELLTTAGARKARAGIQHFEEVRDFFVKALHFEPKTRRKVRLIAFDSPQEWKRFRPAEVATAFYRSGMDRDVIAMESLSGEVYQIAVHEYVHLLLRHSGGTFPVWLNEGLAELYSSMNAQGGKMRVGDLHVGRYQLLQHNKWLPMEQLLAVDHRSPIYTEKSHAGIFYSQSWALCHMLVLGDAYRGKSGEFIRKIASEDVPAAKAFQDVYGKTLFKVLKDLEDYLSANSIRIALFNYKPEQPLAPEIRPASSFESDLAVARLLSYGPEPRDAEEIFERLETQNAGDLELAEAHGFHLLGRNKPEEAKQRLARAIAAGSQNPRLHMRYAFLMQNDSAAEAVKAMQRAVELEPGDMEMRYFLGRLLLQAQKHGEALSTLVTAKPVPPEHVVGYFEALGYIYLKFKKPDEARKMAQRAVALAKSEIEGRQTTALLREIDRWEEAEASRLAAEERFRKYEEARAKAAGAGRDTVPVKERGVKPEVEEQPVVAQSSPYPIVTGKLQRVDCVGQRATLHVFAAGKLRRFEIEDPTAVTITGTGVNGSTAEFTCGPQKGLTVSVGHSDGVVRTLGFH